MHSTRYISFIIIAVVVTVGGFYCEYGKWEITEYNCVCVCFAVKQLIYQNPLTKRTHTHRDRVTLPRGDSCYFPPLLPNPEGTPFSLRVQPHALNPLWKPRRVSVLVGGGGVCASGWKIAWFMFAAVDMIMTLFWQELVCVCVWFEALRGD